MAKYLVFNLNNIGRVSSSAYIAVFNQKHIWRTLSNIELFLITEGNLYMEQENFKKPIHKGEVFISRNNIPYGSYKKSKASFYFAHIEQPNVFEISENERPMFDNKSEFVVLPQHFKINNIGHVISLFNEIVNTQRFIGFDKTQNYILKAMISELGYLKDNHGEIAEQTNPLIANIINYFIYSPTTKELNSIKSIATYFGYNQQYLSRVFKKETGIDLSTFLVELKIRKAKENLLNTNKSIKVIANELGYRQDYFQKLFKSNVGLTPIEFRKNTSATIDSYIKDITRIIK